MCVCVCVRERERERERETHLTDSREGYLVAVKTERHSFLRAVLLSP